MHFYKSAHSTSETFNSSMTKNQWKKASYQSNISHLNFTDTVSFKAIFFTIPLTETDLHTKRS